MQTLRVTKVNAILQAASVRYFQSTGCLCRPLTPFGRITVHWLQADSMLEFDKRVLQHAFICGKGLDFDCDTPPCDKHHCCAAQEAVVWCTTCGSNVHDQCFGKWVEQRRKVCQHYSYPT